MTREEVVRLAKEAEEELKSFDDWRFADREALWFWMFERGVQIGATAEREECAKVCEEHLTGGSFRLRETLAAAIRARGNHDV